MMNLDDRQNVASKPALERRSAALLDEHVHALIFSARFHLDRVGIVGVSARYLVTLVLKCVSQGHEKDLGVDPPTLADLECPAALKFYLKSFLRAVIDKLPGAVQTGEVGLLLASNLSRSATGFKTASLHATNVLSEDKQPWLTTSDRHTETHPI
jgi:hypothetical protein